MKNLNFAFILLLATVSFLHAQPNLNNQIFKTYDALVGTDNTGLFNGTEFTDLYLNTDGTYRYLQGFDYSKGTVTYNGQYYVNVSLKYDLLEDALIARSEDNLSIFNIKLIPNFVASFSIHNRDFILLTNTNLGLSGNGFFEEAYLGTNLKLYIKHAKKMKDRAKEGGVEYRFKNNNSYIVKIGGKYTLVNSKRDLRKLIPEKEGQIREFYKTYRALYKTNRELFMINLIKYLDAPKQS
nr:hypothetical protein [Aequorivita sp. S2608]